MAHMTASSMGTAAVVGAGVFGVTAALELARRGWGVTLLDRGSIPHPEAASTDVSKIVRMDYGRDAFYTELAAEAMEGWRRWSRQSPEPLFHETGFLLLARSRLSEGSFEGESLRVLSRRGTPPERLDQGAISRRFPAWARGGFVDGYFNPRAGWVESGAAVAWLVTRAGAQGVTVREGAEAAGLLQEADRVTGVALADGQTVRCDTVVVAAGARTPDLIPGLGEVMWATGQPVFHLRTDDSKALRGPEFPVWTADVSETGWYGFPALPDGTVKIANHGVGRRLDSRRPEEGVEPQWETRLRAFLDESLPELAEAPVVFTRLCPYCDTFDSDFWIAAHPERTGLVVAAGGSGHGFKFGPVLGPLVADAVEGVHNPGGRRFRWREPGERRLEAARAGSP